jgi:hypothetical protein
VTCSLSRGGVAARLRRRARGRLLVFAALALAACEPSGPGRLTGFVQAPVATGAVVLEVTGTGVTGFADVGDARAFSGDADPSASSHRVVVVAPSRSRLRFRVDVEDVANLRPTAVVVSAVDYENRRISSLAGYSVTISR